MESRKRKEIKSSSSAPLKKRKPISYDKKKTVIEMEKNAAAALTELSFCIEEPPKAPTQIPLKIITANPPRATTAPSSHQQAAMNGKVAEDGNESDSDLSSLSSRSNGLTTPKVVHTPPLNRMMVDHTYTDYSVVNEESLSLLLGNENLNNHDLTTNVRRPNLDTGSEDDKQIIKAKNLKKLKKIFKNVGQTKKNSGGVVQPFPVKLMEVLDRGDMDEAISWIPHGRAFVVLQSQVFVNEVLPRFFKQSKIMSFTRQLNLWGFKRITKGPDAKSYYHELFLRGRPRLCMMMRRQKIKGTGIKLTPNPHTEPNFYEISKNTPLPPPAKKELHPLPPLQQQLAMPGMRGPKSPHRLITHCATTSNYHPPNYPRCSKETCPGRTPLLNRETHRMQYPSHSQICLGPSVLNNSASSLLLIQEPPAPRHRNNGIRNMPEINHSYAHHLNSQNNYPSPSISSPFYSNRQNTADHLAVKLRTEQENMHLTASLLRQRALLEKEDQRQRTVSIASAQELLHQVNRIYPNSKDASTPGGYPHPITSVEALKQRLLHAARTLENTPPVGKRHDAMVLHRWSPTAASQSQPESKIASHHAVDVPAFMSVLEQTQKVTAAVQKQSVILQKFAQDLNACHHLGSAGKGIGGGPIQRNVNYPHF